MTRKRGDYGDKLLKNTFVVFFNLELVQQETFMFIYNAFLINHLVCVDVI